MQLPIFQEGQRGPINFSAYLSADTGLYSHPLYTSLTWSVWCSCAWSEGIADVGSQQLWVDANNRVTYWHPM